jgi:PleD family two-component response regulator
LDRLKEKSKKSLAEAIKSIQTKPESASEYDENSFWDDANSSIEKFVLLTQLANSYGCDLKWLLSGTEGSTVNIIVIDSSLYRRNSVKTLLLEMLGDEKAMVMACENVRDALISSESFQADFILNDFKLPEETNTEFSQRLEKITVK